jgi:MEKHLA domain
MACNLFEMSFDQLTRLPSRKSAEPMAREQRQKFLDAVKEKGYIDNYEGVRISSTGRRFLIQDVVVWEVFDDEGVRRGQAATFDRWEYVKEKEGENEGVD